MRIIGNVRKRIKNFRGFELNEIVINGRIFEWHFTRKRKRIERTKRQLNKCEGLSPYELSPYEISQMG